MSADARELHHIASNHVSIGRGFLPAFSAPCRCKINVDATQYPRYADHTRKPKGNHVMTLTPRAHRYAFQIWRFCEPLGWNVTLQDIADEIGLPPNKVSYILNQKGWSGRVRTSRKDYQIGIDAYSHIGSRPAGVSVEFDEVMG